MRKETIFLSGALWMGMRSMQYVLKLSNPKGILVEELQGINHLMNYLKSCGLTLSYPLTASNGEDIVFLSHSDLIEEEQPKNLSRVACANFAAECNEQHMQDARTAPSELIYYIRILQFVPGTILQEATLYHPSCIV